MLIILVQKENEQGQIHIFQDTKFESYQVHQLTIMYCFGHTNHDILLIFFISKSLQTLFCVRVIRISNVFHV